MGFGVGHRNRDPQPREYDADLVCNWNQVGLVYAGIATSGWSPRDEMQRPSRLA